MSTRTIKSSVRQKRAISASEPRHNPHCDLSPHTFHPHRYHQRTRSGDLTPKTYGLGVPAAHRRAMPARPRAGSSTSQTSSFMTHAKSPQSTTCTPPAVVLSPAPDCIFKIDDDLISPHSLAANSRDDLDSPPLDEILDAVANPHPHEDTFPEHLAHSILRARPRAATTASTKSVDFSLPTPASNRGARSHTTTGLIPIARPDLTRSDTMDMADFSPDPIFNRSLASPKSPVRAAIVEPIGGFDITNLRKDSYGELPKLTQPSQAPPDTPGVVLVEAPPPTPPQLSRVNTARPSLPLRQHSSSSIERRQGYSPLARPFPSTVIQLAPAPPPQALLRDCITGRRPILMKSATTTSLTPAYVFAEHMVFTGPARMDGGFGSLVEWRASLGVGAAVAPGLLRRLSGSVEASRESLRHVLGDNAVDRGREAGAEAGRRHSAWGIGGEGAGVVKVVVTGREGA